MQKTHIIVLDSADRISGDSSQFQVQLSPACEAPKIIELLAVNLPLTMYNVTSSNNIIPLYMDDATPVYHLVSISQGNYALDELLVELANVLSVASGKTFTCIFNAITFVIQITCLSQKFLFGWNISGPINSSASLLGFDYLTGPILSSYFVNTLSGAHSINLSIPLYFYIDISEFGVFVRSSHQDDYGTFVITTNGNGGDINYFTTGIGYHLVEPVYSSRVQVLNIKLKTKGNKLLDLRGNDWTMVLRFTYC